MTPMPNAPHHSKSFRMPEDLYREAQLSPPTEASRSLMSSARRWSDTSKPARRKRSSVGTCNQPHGTTSSLAQTRGGDPAVAGLSLTLLLSTDRLRYLPAVAVEGVECSLDGLADVTHRAIAVVG